MRKINIYITQTFRGRLDGGEGKFYIVLELIDQEGIPHTREHMKGYTNTTKNRLDLLACIEALSHVTEACEITIYIDSRYMAGNEGRLSRWEAEGWISGQGQIKNQDLWKQYREAAEKHLVTILAMKDHSYRNVSNMELRKEIELQEDRRDGKE